MQIKNEKPPIWASIKALLDFDERYTIFTYGDTIYNPAGFHVNDDLIAHETVHMRQQKDMAIRGFAGPARWWKKYLHDPAFRVQQEAEAYRVQYLFAKEHIKDRNQLAEYLMSLANILSGPTYGHAVSLSEALTLIKNI